MTATTIPSLDHLILFLPVSPSKNPTIPPSLSNLFTLTPGGTHADNLTSNTLILLADGCYIELISFLPQDTGSSGTSNHWWGPDANRKGWTDWCLTTPGVSAEENYPRLTDSHAQPVSGGRKRPDGKDVRWSVTFPRGEKGGQQSRGLVPFFCHDVTAREVRVPSDEEKATHKSGVLGVREISVVVKEKHEFDRVVRVYRDVLGVEGMSSDDQSEVSFEIGRVATVKKLEGTGPKVLVRLARSEVDLQRVESRGFWFGDVVLAAEAWVYTEVGTRERIDVEEDVGGIWLEYV